MSPIYVPGKVTLAQQQKIPVVIGEPWGGGYFAGYISHTADGNPTHALIVAPRATGATGTGYTLTTNLKWADETVVKPAETTALEGISTFDGKANTDLMMSLIAAGTFSVGAFPAAKFCVDLNIGGFTDWYLPAQLEMDIAYYNLKPSAINNDTGYGANSYAVPSRSQNNTASYPAQTTLTAFTDQAQQAFVGTSIARHWTSSGAGGVVATNIVMDTGNQGGILKTTTARVRAFRRIAL